MAFPIDVSRAETTPFDGATPHHALLQAFAGRWQGSSKLILPDVPVESQPMALEAQTILGGRWLRATYCSVAMGKPHAGEMLLSFHKDAGVFEFAWVDSFHTGTSILWSEGKPAEGQLIDVLGSYTAGGETWGWRTKLSLKAGTLTLEAFNVLPSGEEMLGLHWVLEQAR